MRLTTEKALPFILGAVPVLIVLVLAGVMSASSAGRAPQNTQGSGASQSTTAIAGTTTATRGSATSSQPTGSGNQSGSGGSPGLCLLLLGCP